MTKNSQTVVVLGASAKPNRFSYKALKLLRHHGHNVIPIHPILEKIDGVPVTATIDRIVEAVDTLSIYVNSSISASLADQIVDLEPGRVIFNPGAESLELQKTLDANSIPYQEACTLVMLNTGAF